MSVLAVAAAVAVTLSAGLACSVLLRLRRLRHELQAMRHAAHHDPLTGLLNRAGLAAAWTALAPTRPVVLLLDLDGFKPVNDTHGHAAGDHVLVTLADRFAAAALGCVARLGGDEFVFVVPGAEYPLTYARIRDLVIAPVELPSGVVVSVHGSFGLTFADCAHLSTVLADADTAMYMAKSVHGTQISVYTRDRGDRTCPGCHPLPSARPGIRVRDMSNTPVPLGADVQ